MLFVFKKNMGKYKDEVIFPIAPKLTEMDDEYISFIQDVKNEIRNQSKRKTNVFMINDDSNNIYSTKLNLFNSNNNNRYNLLFGNDKYY